MKMPAWLAHNWQDGVLRILALLVIWGGCVFLWGTLGAWERAKALEADRAFVGRQMAAMQRWLQGEFAPLEDLAANPRLRAALNLPLNVESTPVQRVLYDFAYSTGAGEVYVVDLTAPRVTMTAGASPLPPAVIEKLRTFGGHSRIMVGVGERSGMVYLARQVPAPLPLEVYVVTPVSLADLGGGRPRMNVPEGRSLGIMVPHTTGSAWWAEGATRFVLQRDGAPDDLLKDGEMMLVEVEVNGFEGVRAGLLRPSQAGIAAMWPRMVVLGSALLLTLMLLWSSSSRLRKTVTARMAPLAGAIAPVVVPLQALVARFKKQLHEDDAPLVDGPGAYGAGDFKHGGGAGLGPRKNGLKRRQFEKDGPKGERHKSFGGGGTTRPDSVNETVENDTLVAESGAFSAMAPAPEAQPPAPLPEEKPAEPERDLTDVIDRSLMQGRVVLLYHPIYRVSDGQVLLHEIYARLLDDDGSHIFPGKFLPIMEKHNWTQRLDAAVFRKVMKEHFSGNRTPKVPLALNIAGTSIESIGYLREVLSHSKGVLQKLAFEVRSQEIVRDPQALKLLKDIQNAGGALAVDYFGGGSAMLEASKTLGFNYVKLDCKRFSISSADKKELISLCLAAKKVSLPVIMEKVENMDMEVFARRAGVAYLQGYALSKPTEEPDYTVLAREEIRAAATVAKPVAAAAAN